MTTPYDFVALEKKWRPYWREIELYKTKREPDKPKYYILDFFPYPSGDGLSVGHCRNYVPTCVAARYARMKGMNVLHPMGWDAFGLPAENYAIKHGISPRITTRRHGQTYKRQMQLVECSYDWSRELYSTDPDYYHWTQWFFLLLYKRGLAYQAVGQQWWCPVDQTILANEQVENGRCWRCGSPVTKKELQQWYFKITDYADRLLADLDPIDWPEGIKMMQRHWIGRSEGAEIIFTADGEEIPVFTTRPDTLFGVTFLVLAPEHPLVERLTTAEQRPQVEGYVAQAQRLSEIERLATDKEKSGVFSGAYAQHPVTGAAIPIWIADYVLIDYGSGAVMGVPGHDQRDYDFARRYALPIVEVVSPDGQPQGVESCYAEPGVMINSGAYNGRSSAAGGAALVDALAEQGLATPLVTYKMRDWLISRQRYWGAPIPIIHCPDCGPVSVPEKDLPVTLPEVEDFAPTGDGRSPLARIDDWVNVSCPACGQPAQRETDTMDGFACSSWYFLRFTSPEEEERPFDPAAVDYWLPVDTYVGGAEHAVMHLLYARFWTKVMYDAGLVSFTEPFQQLRNQGMLHAADGQKMSKSKNNVVTPDEVIAEVGADALRAYILFIGPFEGSVTWDDTNIKGVTRFLERFWRLAQEIGQELAPFGTPAEDTAVERAFRQRLHQANERITSEYEAFKFNTAVAGLMEYLNYLYEQREEAIRPGLWHETLTRLTQIACPIMPFITEEIWQTILGQPESVHLSEWPTADPALLVAEEVTVMVQVNGKLRDRVTVAADIERAALETAVLARPRIQQYTADKEVRKIIVVPQKLVNVVV